MKEKREDFAFCKKCGWILSPTSVGHCPNCGNRGKVIIAEVTDTVKVKDSWESRREFFERNPKIMWLIIAITLSSPLLGLILSGLVGLIIGLFLGFLSYLLGPLAVTKVREIERGSS